jgi:DNA replicative helicase MCM subunit Mcm2 (Cdc46/Mcm family)
MNIKEAKEELIHTVQAYLKKDENGIYRIPAIRQRPMLLIGPPGIGKTQIMEQVAKECRIGLVAYTITHHTRQSAVGLPFIKEECFEGKNCSVTEYTMSEIIASVYRKMQETGLKEGILFIDEINCVSETLAPTMLQFLQCKTFGNQAVPQGWVIVAAGNPPEYNKSVRDFDVVTLDRVRYLEISADYPVWKSYAREQHIHGAILSYLELRPNNFYRVESDVDGMQFVTARGWEDLSNLILTYEELEIPVKEDTVYEFLHHRDVAEDVAAYLDLYRKYQDDYGIEDILAGNVKPEIYARIYEAAFDERISVTNLLLDGLNRHFTEVMKEKELTDAWYAFLK